MGYYINPSNMSKEIWLAEHGKRVPQEEISSHDYSGSTIPVCLVHNGAFTAAGVVYCSREAEAFLEPDGRMKIWFLVEKKALIDTFHGAPWEDIPETVRGKGE